MGKASDYLQLYPLKKIFSITFYNMLPVTRALIFFSDFTKNLSSWASSVDIILSSSDTFSGK